MRRPLLLMTMTILTLTACGSGTDEPREGPLPTAAGEQDPTATVPVEVSTELVDPEGSTVGEARFREDDMRTVVEVDVSGLTAGFHPMALHATGNCAQEGTAGDLPPFPGVGDPLLALPPLLVLEDGVGSMTTLTGPVPLDDLLAGDGTALVVHQAPEDPTALPPSAVGDTGSRLVCGAVGG